MYSTKLTLVDSHRYKIRLLDADGRKNKPETDLGVNVTRNRPPTITMTLPGHDVRVSPVEELRLGSKIEDDFGVLSFGINYGVAGQAEREVVLGAAGGPTSKRSQVDHIIDFESLRAVPDQLVTYFVWAQDFGPDGKPRRTEGDMYFAEVRRFEEIFREAEQSASASSEEQEQEQQGAGRQAEELAELQKEIINGTWKVVRRETGAKPSEPYSADVKLLKESQESALKQAEALGERLQSAESKASLETALRAMTSAAKLLGEAADGSNTKPLKPAVAEEQAAYQALLKLRAHEFQVSRSNSRERSRSRSAGASASQRQINQLELKNDEDRFEQQSKAKPEQLSEKEQEQRETRQVVNRLRELAQRQSDVNERVKELQAALEAAKDEQAKQEIERQLKRLREQQQQLLRDAEELQERMESEQNRDRMAQARQQVEQSREHVRQASEALEQGKLSQALTEGTRASRQLNDVREDLRKQSSNQFAQDLTEMRDQARKMDEAQEKLTEKLQAMKEQTRQSLRSDKTSGQVEQQLEQQQKDVEDLVDRMRKTVGEAEATEPLLAKNLFEAVRKADEKAIPRALEEAAPARGGWHCRRGREVVPRRWAGNEGSTRGGRTRCPERSGRRRRSTP